MEQLIALVDLNDEVIGFGEKHLVHTQGLLHRAFSILVFNGMGEMLLQRRALCKYHSPGLWTNTCCSHLPKGAEMEQHIHERLHAEMGFDCNLRFVSKFHYRVDFRNGMIENEIDHIFIGRYEGEPRLNPLEACEWGWRNEASLREDVGRFPGKYTYWLGSILRNHFDDIVKSLQSC